MKVSANGRCNYRGSFGEKSAGIDGPGTMQPNGRSSGSVTGFISFQIAALNTFEHFRPAVVDRSAVVRLELLEARLSLALHGRVALAGCVPQPGSVRDSDLASAALDKLAFLQV